MSERARIEAARLAAQLLAGTGLEAGTGARLFSLCIFFESWIVEGGDATETKMQLLGPKRRRKLEVIAGGRL